MRNAEVYEITVAPGKNADTAAKRMATYIINRWLPNNAGGVHVLCTPALAKALRPFFCRTQATRLIIDTTGNKPTITEKP